MMANSAGLSRVSSMTKTATASRPKAANIVFEDANVTAAINGSAWAIFHNQGQACIAGSRLILHSAIADEFIERFIGLARSIRLGNPLLPDTEMGPLTSAMQTDPKPTTRLFRQIGACPPDPE